MVDIGDIRPDDVLVVVDCQLDFCPGGALAVEGGDTIMAGIATLAGRFAHVIVTQDYHPAGHSSFASRHEGKAPFDEIEMPYGRQILWPDHCVQGTPGADFHPDVTPAVARACLILRKGMDPAVDNYSAFRENDHATATGFGAYLRARGLRRCFFVGLAYDVCVGFSAVDGATEGFETIVLTDLSRAIAMPKGGGRTSIDEIEDRFRSSGVRTLDSRVLG